MSATATAPDRAATSRPDHPDCQYVAPGGASCTNAAEWLIAHGLDQEGDELASCTDHVGHLLTFPKEAPSDAEERWEVRAI